MLPCHAAPRNRLRCGKDRKPFFSEEKKQKTFSTKGYAPPHQSDRNRKSFLVLFFKKEHLPSPPHPRTPP
jgi:hypothetical protein